jgi:hypothetical protein
MRECSTPNYIDGRLRQLAPSSLPVVPGSTPVVAFGDVRNAKFATLGLNPSKREFLDRAGNELTGSERRLETLSSLGVTDLASAPSDVIRKVFEGCNGYFQRRPYRRWFDVLEKILTPLGASYYDGTACHLDLVQWATDPTWGKLRGTHKRSLVEADLSFLRQQLLQEQIRLLLLNGSGVVKAYCEGFGCGLAEKVIAGKIGWNLFCGRTARGARVVGWNKNLQGSHGVSSEDLKALGAAIIHFLDAYGAIS